MTAQLKAEFEGPHHEWWLRPSDASLVPLMLQSSEEPQLMPKTLRWSRIGKPSSRVSPLLRASYWVGSSLLVPGTRKYDLSIRSGALAALKLLIAWPIFCLLVCWTGHFGITWSQLVNADADIDTRYDTVLTSKDTSEESRTPSPSHTAPAYGAETFPGSAEHVGAPSYEQSYLDNIRLGRVLPASGTNQTNSSPISLRPRYLCFVRDFEKGEYETVKVSDYLEQHGDDIDLEFVFVSYTRLQFRVATEDEIARHEYSDEATREANKELARRDRKTLALWGINAAKRVGKRAFWLDFECVRNDDGVARSTSSSEDVYRICDIVRAAHSMIIAIGPSASDKMAALLEGCEPPAYKRENVTPWLRQWGSRLWTLPELLLCPGEYRIHLYVLGDPSEPKAMAKRNFAERAWDDAEAVKELVDHFEGSAILTELRLIESALACFSRRQTDQFSQGDLAYATMGLFPNRHRPQVNKEDSGFQAFAKLSLANDGGAFLSRLICLAPQPAVPWYQTEDCWGVKPSDINPLSNVSSIVGPDAIMLEGVHGATIHWDNLDPEPFFDRNSQANLNIIFRAGFSLCVIVPLAFACSTCAAILFAGSEPDERLLRLTAWVPGAIISFALLAPMMLVGTRGRAKQPLKSRLLGIEGIVDAASVEKHLWGFSHGTLTDATPQFYRDAQDLGPSSTSSSPSPSQSGQEHHSFTLVDTHMMTVRHFRCSIPPVAMFVCGSEDGMQRTLLCSYDWRTETFHRQSVLREKNRSLDQMHRLNKVRFSLASHPDVTTLDSTSNSVASSQMIVESEAGNVAKATKESPRLRGGYRTWKTELLFIVICVAGINIPGLYNDSTSKKVLLYNIFFIGAQLPAFLLLSYVPLSQVSTYAFAANIFLRILRDNEFSYRILEHLALTHYAVKGVLTLTLIQYMLSWYSADELAFRFLLWNLVSPRLFDIVDVMDHQYTTNAILIFINIVVLNYLASLKFSDLIGVPKDVIWLTLHQKIYYTRRAAARIYFSNTSGFRGRDLQQWTIGVLRPLLVFGISLLSSLNFRGNIPDEYGRRVSDTSDIYIVVVGILIGSAAYKFPSQSYIMLVSCSVISGLSALLSTVEMATHPSFLFRLFIRLNEVVPPLLWSVVFRQAPTRAEAMGTVSLSLVGGSVGRIILTCTDKIPNFTVQLPVFLGQVILWALLWACKYFDRVRLPEITPTSVA